MQLLAAPEDTIVQLPEGLFRLDRGLIANRTDVHITGYGVDRTILDFSDQVDGKAGLSIAGKNVTVSNMTILNAAGDGIKVSNSENVNFMNLKVGWTAAVDNVKGSYGIYPVSSTKIRIESCETFGATEAGIYVGQSVDSLIIGNKTYNNTVGIEAENSKKTIIERNEVGENSIGILISDIPGLPVFGSDTHIHNNRISNNNKDNTLQNVSHLSFGQSGLGVLLVATKTANVGDNVFAEHDIADVAALNYVSTNFSPSRVLYDPNVRDVVVGPNDYQQGEESSTTRSPSFYKWQLASGNHSVLWDGRVTRHKLYAELPIRKHLCLEALPPNGGIIEKGAEEHVVSEFSEEVMLCPQDR